MKRIVTTQYVALTAVVMIINPVIVIMSQEMTEGNTNVLIAKRMERIQMVIPQYGINV